MKAPSGKNNFPADIILPLGINAASVSYMLYTNTAPKSLLVLCSGSLFYYFFIRGEYRSSTSPQGYVAGGEALWGSLGGAAGYTLSGSLIIASLCAFGAIFIISLMTTLSPHRRSYGFYMNIIALLVLIVFHYTPGVTGGINSNTIKILSGKGPAFGVHALYIIVIVAAAMEFLLINRADSLLSLNASGPFYGRISGQNRRLITAGIASYKSVLLTCTLFHIGGLAGGALYMSSAGRGGSHISALLYTVGFSTALYLAPPPYAIAAAFTLSMLLSRTGREHQKSGIISGGGNA